MSTRAVFAVGLALAVLTGAIGPAVGVVGDASFGLSGDATVHRTGDALDSPTHQLDSPAHQSDSPAQRIEDARAQYKVSLDNVTVKTWLLRNSTVRNATVEELVVRNATSPEGARENVTLTNVTVQTFEIQRARLTNVTAQTLVIRNKSVLSVPGGDLIDPNVENRTIDRQWTENATVSGVIIDQITIDAATLCGNATLGQEADNPSAFDPRTDDGNPDIAVQNGTVGQALIIRGSVSNWSVGSVDQPQPTNASLPQGCNRG